MSGYPGYPAYGAYPGYASQGAYPPEGYPPQGYPPQGYPPQGYPPQAYPPQGYPPQGYPPQGYPPPQGQTSSGGYPPQEANSRPADPSASPTPSQQQRAASAGPTVGVPAPAPTPAPVSTPVCCVLGQQYCLPYETVLIMRELLTLTGADMDIMDTTGRLHFHLSAKLFSMKRTRVLYDAARHPVCCMGSKLFSLKSETYVCPGEEPNPKRAILSVKRVILSLTPTLQVFMKNNRTTFPDFQIHGSLYEFNFQITNAQNLLMAQISRDAFSGMAIVTGRDTYFIRVMAGVDMALMVALVTIIEETVVGDGGGVPTAF